MHTQGYLLQNTWIDNLFKSYASKEQILFMVERFKLSNGYAMNNISNFHALLYCPRVIHPQVIRDIFDGFHIRAYM